MPAPRATLELQELGERTLPSAVLQPLNAVDPVAPVAIVQHSHPLQGTGTGTYHEPAVTVDAGTSFTMSGTVHLNGLGSFQVAGGVHGVGMVAWGRAGGELVLTGAQGTITLLLHGQIQHGFAALPRELVYTVSGGTGAYSHLTGYGTVGMTLMPAPAPLGHPPMGTIAFLFS
jgi:hypothetical protein